MYNPKDLYDELYNNASTRKKRTLKIINQACEKQSQTEKKDFSLTTIAKIIASDGGPTEQALRNKNGRDYRNLIACWAQYSNSSMKKPSKEKNNTIYDELLSSISEPTTKSLVGILIAENRKLKAENNLLKKDTVYTIDMRKESKLTNQVVMQAPYDFSESEIEALSAAISGDFFEEQGWTIDTSGRVKSGNYTLYKAGYINAIRKVLEYI